MNQQNSFAHDFLTAVACSPDADGDRALIDLLEGFGFTFGARSAANLRLLSSLFPPEALYAITAAALATPAPDMALNGMERVSAVVPADDLLAVCGSKIRLAQLLAICGSSPFLTNIICRSPYFFSQLFVNRRIDTGMTEQEMLADLRGFVTSGSDYAALLQVLRRFKFMEILRIAARDLTGLASLEEVMVELSALATVSLQVAYEVSWNVLAAEHGTPLMTTPDGERQAEFTILGMGKLGGRELNFSSDIDIIYFYSSDQGGTTGIDDGQGGKRGAIPLHTFFVKLSEMITKALSQVTGDGFVFRVDLGLRPEGKSGELAVSIRAAETYYEYWGQSWERAAMLKARPVAGSLELGEHLLTVLQPFIYRKYLDYDLIEDMMAMKKKIDASLARGMEGECNIKLGRGGIREIEFFIQALQLVYAGKNPVLRQKNTLQALTALKDARLISADDHSRLSEAYRFLRTVEHRIQVVQERQTHNLPKKDDEFQALARRCGFLRPDGVERFRSTLEEHRSHVSTVYGSLFLARDERLREEVRPEIYYFFDPKADPDMIKDMLAERRFEQVDAAFDNLVLLRDGPPRAHLTERARRILEKIAPVILQEVFASPDPDMALANMEKFLCAIGSRSSFFSLLAENREILKLMVSLFGMSEFLSKIFIGHPELLDSMVSRTTETGFKEKAAMSADLAALLDQADDFEERLDVIRRYRHEEFLRVGINDIYGNVGQTEIARQLTVLADVCLDAAYRLAREELRRFGTPQYTAEDGTVREAGFAIVAMGKMGGMELNYHSDLDIIYIYDQQGNTSGEKSISNREYFAKVGQKIISILTMQTREGYVYKIDTRLRPSGNAGPLVTSLQSFREYHREEAQIWERQALTKARVVIGEESLRQSVEEIVAQTVYGSPADESVRGEIHRLRMRMEVELAKEREGLYNIKTGRGGMVDVEFIVQFLQLIYGCDREELRSSNTLIALKAINAAGILGEQESATLLTGYKFLRRLENRLRIIHDHSINDLGGAPEYLDKLALRMGYDPKLRHPGELLVREYEQVTQAIRGVYDRVLGENSNGG